MEIDANSNFVQCKGLHGNDWELWGTYRHPRYDPEIWNSYLGLYAQDFGEIERIVHLSYLKWVGICATCLDTREIGMANKEMAIRARVLPMVMNPKFPIALSHLRKREKEIPDGSFTKRVIGYRS